MTRSDLFSLSWSAGESLSTVIFHGFPDSSASRSLDRPRLYFVSQILWFFDLCSSIRFWDLWSSCWVLSHPWLRDRDWLILFRSMKWGYCFLRWSSCRFICRNNLWLIELVADTNKSDINTSFCHYSLHYLKFPDRIILPYIFLITFSLVFFLYNKFAIDLVSLEC